MSAEKNEEQSKVKKILNLVVNLLIWLFVIFAVVMTMLAFAAQSSPDGVPSIGGKVILTVQTPSMEPTFCVGDIIIGQKLSLEEQQSLKVDDVITFDAGDLDRDGRRDLNSHRIKRVETAADGSVIYYTAGDNNILDDQTPVQSANVICKWTGTRLKGVGTALDFLQQPTGFLVVVVLPLLLFFIYELIVFIRKFFEVKNSGKKQITAADEELIRQRAIEEYIRSQQAKNGQAPSDGPTDAESPSAAPEAAASAEAAVTETPTEPTVEEAPAEAPTEPTAEEAPVEAPTEPAVEEAPAEAPNEPTAEEAPVEAPTEPAAEEASVEAIETPDDVAPDVEVKKAPDSEPSAGT